MKETIGQIIRRLRKERDLTQEELAEKLNVSSQAISKWENGSTIPDISQVVPLAKLFGISTDYLLSNETTIRDGRNQVTYPLWVMGFYNTDAYAHLYNFTIELIPIFQRNMSEKSFLDIEYHEKDNDGIIEVTHYWITKDEVFKFRGGDSEACKEATLRICEKGIYGHVI